MQELIVIVAVTGAAAFLTVRYTPKALVSAAGSRIVQMARQCGWSAVAGRMEKALDGMKQASACGGCSGCSTEDARRGGNRNSISVDALRRTARR